MVFPVNQGSISAPPHSPVGNKDGEARSEEKSCQPCQHFEIIGKLVNEGFDHIGLLASGGSSIECSIRLTWVREAARAEPIGDDDALLAQDIPQLDAAGA
ncbi:hypothetical protein BA190_08960 [Labrys sp. WJW]|uniref:hypothetical protein n=1 Tax=Labrys sp. WJW TaxID=1737983 RepID=UPI0008343305|nr:hypothetical protein [Labrys sp. WJW]OCC05520.1 hypothetical protein BA190_08960 [Labrys sp. WJW]